jgi:uncharacterized protein (DUF1684 family)
MSELHPPDDESGFVLAWQSWRARREAALTHPHGFLAITSINWLHTTPTRFTDAPGEWWADADGAHVVLRSDEHLDLPDDAEPGQWDLGVIPEGDEVNLPWGDGVIEAARRGGGYIVRPRHPNAPVLAAYRGTPAYAPTLRWVLPGTFEAFPEPRTITGASVVDGLELQHHAPGIVHFEVDGAHLSLLCFADADADHNAEHDADENNHDQNDSGSTDMWVLFTDATAGVTTSGSCRVLELQRPHPGDPSGAVTLDFNRARNLPCTYTTLATCPLPPPGNRLPVAIEAGEMAPFANRR